MALLTRLLLVLLVAGSTGAVAWSMLGGKDAALADASLRVEQLDDAGYSSAITITDAAFQGRDENNNPLDVRAQGVTPQDSDYTVVSLDQAEARLFAEDGAPLDIVSSGGLYDRGQQTLQLTGDVQLQDDKGLTVRSDIANIDLSSKDIDALGAVSGNAPSGSWTSERMQIRDNGNQVILSGRSTVTLLPNGTANRTVESEQ